LGWVIRDIERKMSDMPQAVQSLLEIVKRIHQQQPKNSGRWSFVDRKGNKQWVWLAMNVATREIVGCTIGDRSGHCATALWQSM